MNAFIKQDTAKRILFPPKAPTINNMIAAKENRLETSDDKLTNPLIKSKTDRTVQTMVKALTNPGALYFVLIGAEGLAFC